MSGNNPELRHLYTAGFDVAMDGVDMRRKPEFGGALSGLIVASQKTADGERVVTVNRVRFCFVSGFHAQEGPGNANAPRG